MTINGDHGDFLNSYVNSKLALVLMKSFEFEKFKN